MKSEGPVQLDWVVRLRGVAALWVMAYHLWIKWGGDEFKFGMPGDFSYGLRGRTRLALPETLDFYQAATCASHLRTTPASQWPRPARLALGAVAFAMGYRTFTLWINNEHGIWITWTAAYPPGASISSPSGSSPRARWPTPGRHPQPSRDARCWA